AARCWAALTTFFGDVLEHPLVQEELGDEELEALDLGLELADAAAIVGPGGVVLLPPAVVGGLGDAQLAADVSHRQPPGQVALGLPKQPPDLLRAPSLAHESLLDLSYPVKDSHSTWTSFRGADHLATDSRKADHESQGCGSVRWAQGHGALAGF